MEKKQHAKTTQSSSLPGTDSRARFEAFWRSRFAEPKTVATGFGWDCWQACEADALERAIPATANLLDHYDQLPNDIKTDPGFDSLRSCIERLRAYHLAAIRELKQ